MKELPEFGIHYKKSELPKSMLSAPKTLNSEAAIRRCSVKKVFLEISQN